jgi:hypothetical protein
VNFLRIPGIIVGNIFAWVLFGTGMISPLTPSEGMPRIYDWLIFAGSPILLLLICWRVCHGIIGRIAMLAQFVLIAGVSGYLFWLLMKSN